MPWAGVRSINKPAFQLLHTRVHTLPLPIHSPDVGGPDPSGPSGLRSPRRKLPHTALSPCSPPPVPSLPSLPSPSEPPPSWERPGVPARQGWERPGVPARQGSCSEVQGSSPGSCEPSAEIQETWGNPRASADIEATQCNQSTSHLMKRGSRTLFPLHSRF